MKMEKDEFIELVKELTVKPSAGFLATVNNKGNPEIRAIENLRCPEIYDSHPANVIAEYTNNPLTVYICTTASSLKMKQISENNNVAVYFSIPKEYKGVMLEGKIEILDDENFKKKIWHENWITIFKKGKEDPDYMIIKLEPKRLKGYHHGRYEMDISEFK